ncbi:MAG: TMEM175 family protein [Caldilineaceae bacterium]
MARKTSKSSHSAESKPAVTKHEELGLERLIFFSDAVFAIAITLLALEIRLPAAEGPLSNGELIQALLAIWPKYLAYGISFLVLGAFWLSHHRKFQLIQRYDRILLLLNLLLLMAVALIPFPTAVLSEYGNQAATIFYALAVAVANLLAAVLWWYVARRHRLIDPHVSEQQRRRELWAPLLVSAIFLLSIGLAFINDDLAKFSWISIIVVPLVL